MEVRKLIGYILYVFIGARLPHGVGKQFYISSKIRQLSAKMLFDKCGTNINIGRKIRFSRYVSIGNNSSIGDNSYISGKVVIGNNVMIAPAVSFIAMNHVFDDENPLITTGAIREKIEIKDHCWIGYGAIILAGVTIGEGCIVGAGAVVVKDIPPLCVVGGVPARILKERK